MNKKYKIMQVQNPLYTPDLALCDVFLFSEQKINCKSNCFEDVEDIKRFEDMEDIKRFEDVEDIKRYMKMQLHTILKFQRCFDQ